MADSKKRGRKPAPIRAETSEARRLTEFLRELRERSGKTYNDLAAELNWSRSSIGNHYSGAVPPREVVVQLVVATAFPHEVEQRKADAVRLWERATNPPSAQVAVRPEAAGSPSAVARHMHDGRSRLSEADQQSRRLARELAAAQELVVMLTALNTSLDARLQQLAATPDEDNSEQVQQQLAEVLHQLEQTQKDLVEARQGRDQAEALAATARRRCLVLEEELALLRLLDPDADVPAEPREPEEAPELDTQALLADPAEALSTARRLLDEGRALRKEAADSLGVAATTAATSKVVRRSERWQASALVLGRALGCVLAMSGAAVQVATAPAWHLLTAPVLMLGVLLAVDPWHWVAVAWPWLRATIRREPLPRQLPVRLGDLAPRLLRGLSAALAAAGAGYTTSLARDDHLWWLYLTLPGTAVTALVTVCGYDRALARTLRAAFDDVHADLKAPVARPPLGQRRLPSLQRWLEILDGRWIDARVDELKAFLRRPWSPRTPWWLLICLLPFVFLALAPIGAVLEQFFSPLAEHAGAVWATINQPVTRFLATRTGGLPLTASAAHALWLAGGIAIALLSAATRAFAARLTWALWGAATVWMTWAGTPATTRPTAAGLTALVWGIASVIALNGLGSRPRVTTINLIGDVPAALQQHDSSDSPASDANAQEADSRQQSTAST
ncbi:helix-turn-helix transcriptional regulator [Streptomyces sp. TLI_185]|uniref:helix-turn-helix domain-containing protein n=1 Tax=Streptomyces sp. TLI_185 TaxID=2485151 RepID=UPI000F502E04|nr:helix-turn-helix transcriptional regulator [Streptomyces sp. TLI_185]RPF30341.1 helix-turn-helix protein [Streptomyces sp. TLI_185]